MTRRNLILFWMLICACMAGRAQTLRERINFNRDWVFQLGDHPGAEEPSYDDSGWERIGLPHSFSTPYFMSPQFYTGYGWYRKHFAMPPAGAKKHWFLEFEGAFQDAEVYVNGILVGRHQGGYTGFSLDVTSALQRGDNVLSVRLNNLWNPRLAPRAGEHTFSGGIYRDAYLVGMNPLHVTWCGSFVRTPSVSTAAAQVSVQTEVVNQGGSVCTVDASTVIRDARGLEVGRFKARRIYAPGETRSITQLGVVVQHPHLWSPDHPYRYRAVTALYVAGRKVDEYVTAFGIRSIRWSADSGFFLNDRHVYLRGANVHQDHAGWGDAVTNAGFYRDVRLMKEAGFNFIRASHYPHDPAFYDACDSLGILCWSENAFWGIGGSDKTPEGYWNASAYPTVAADQGPFEESIERQLREMIRIQRNHPSVIAWSMSNEPFFTAPATLEKVRALLRTLVGIAHSSDPTRPAAIGGAQRPLGGNRIDRIGDIAGYNGDGASLPVFQAPGVPNVVAEYGSVSARRPGKFDPGWGALVSDDGREVYAWRAGQSVWCGFDHGSIAGSELGSMGLVDYFRIPKRAWYWYRERYLHIPPPVWPRVGVANALRLTAEKFRALTDGTDDIRIQVTVVDAAGVPVSNNPPVDLTIVSGPGAFPTGRHIHFAPESDITILDGQAAIECRAWYAGRCRVLASSPGLLPDSIDLTFDGPVAFISGVTPPVADHPYTRFTANIPDTISRSFGRNNPTFASSSGAGHSSGLAADGDSSTFWCPLAGDSAAWWKLDMEKRVKVNRVDINFGTTEPLQYIVEIGDQDHWSMVELGRVDGAIRIIEVPCTTGREVRIRFPVPSKARLSEVSVTGEVMP